MTASIPPSSIRRLVPEALLAGAVVGLALALTAGFRAATGQETLLLFVFSVMAASWLGGVRSGLITTAVSLLAGVFLLHTTAFALRAADTANVAWLALFSAVGTAASLTFGRARTSQRDLRQRVRSLEELSAALRESEERMRIAQEAAGFGTWDWDVATNALRWSEATERMHGFAPGTFPGTFDAYMGAIHPEDRAQAAQSIAAAVESSTDFEMENRVLWPDGTVRWVSGQGMVIRDAAGKAVRMVGVGIDITARFEAEQALRQSEEQYRSFAESLPLIAWRADADGAIEYINQRWAEYSGLSGKESREGAWAAAIHPDDRARIGEGWAAALRASAVFEVEHRIRAADGSYRWFLTRAVPILDGRGRILSWLGSAIDIHDRKGAEEERAFLANATAVLSSSLDYEVTLRALATLAVPRIADCCVIDAVREGGRRERVAFVHTDPEKASIASEMERRFAASGAQRAVAADSPQLIAEIPDDPPSAAAADDAHLRLLGALGLRQAVCVPLTRGDHPIGAITLGTGPGRTLGASDVALAEELARRASVAVEHAELFGETRREKARFESIVASVGYGVYQVDARGRMVYINPAAADLFGYTPDELAGATIHEVIHFKRADGSAFPARECPLLNAMRVNESYGAVDSYVRKDGSTFDVEVHSTPIVVDGEVRGAVVVFQDVSERLAQERLKDEFLGFASHELRSPLTSVNGFAKWLARKAAAGAAVFDEDAREAIDTISTEADRMTNIVEVFLDLTRIQSGRLATERAPVDLRDVVRSEAEALRTRWPVGRVTVAVPDDPVIAETDVYRLQQVLTNLLDNAAKYGGEPAAVDVVLKCAYGAALISVRDNGSGIPPEDQPHIFDRFFRGHTREPSQKKGLGVGLYIVKRIVDRLGGRISFISTATGTEFIIALPLAPAATAGPASA